MTGILSLAVFHLNKTPFFILVSCHVGTYVKWKQLSATCTGSTQAQWGSGLLTPGNTVAEKQVLSGPSWCWSRCYYGYITPHFLSFQTRLPTSDLRFIPHCTWNKHSCITCTSIYINLCSFQLCAHDTNLLRIHTSQRFSPAKIV